MYSRVRVRAEPGASLSGPAMPDDQRYRLAALTDRAALPRIAAISLVVLGLGAGFVYVGGGLSPGRLTQARMIDTFEQVNGPHPGFRRNHAKGVCVAGEFQGNGKGARLSTAAVLAAGSVPVVGRFALAGGDPAVPDGPTAVRSLALSFRPPQGEEWRTGMNDIPVFPVATAQAFHDLLEAGRPDPTTGKPAPARMQAFLAAYPASAGAIQRIKATTFATGFANASYNSLNAFRFVDAAGKAIPVRWAMEAIQPYLPQSPAQAASPDKNYLFDDLAAQLTQGPLQWRLVVTLGAPGDPTNDATLPWPDTRERVEIGTLTIDHLESEATGNCRDINFDPLVLPAGIEPSDDPLLSARSAAYATSFTRRAGEPKTASAVQVTDIAAKGP